MIHEIEPGTGAGIGSLQVTAAETPHTPESLAFQMVGGGSVLGYTGDTGPSDALAEFFRGVDLLLSECSLPEDLVADNHLSPESLARMAVSAGVEWLLVTHVYPQLRRLDVATLIERAGFGGEITMAHDGLELEI